MNCGGIIALVQTVAPTDLSAKRFLGYASPLGVARRFTVNFQYNSFFRALYRVEFLGKSAALRYSNMQ